jgi:alkylation response protein AidB-like acyl-CoA dehydrogenase
MDFELTPEQREIQTLARELAEAEIAPHAPTWDREHRFPRELIGRLGELGLMGVCIPEELGGAGADFLSYVLVLEELSRADAGIGVTVAVHTSAAALPIVRFGTDEQKEELVPPLARGDHLGAFALTESDSGSDARALKARAETVDGGWRLSGRKQWITNSSAAGTILVFARGDAGISCFLVDRSWDGVQVTDEHRKLGLRSSTTTDLVLDGVHAPAGRLLGAEGKGFRIAMATLDGGRIGIAAQALGIAQAAFELARAYALERQQFGRSIAEFGAIQEKFAAMATELDAARLLVYRAAWLRDRGEPHGEAGAKAKLFASSVARRHTGEAIQILGGYGYTKEFPAERLYRDAKITEIYEGTSEIQRLVIARAVLGLAERAVPTPA